MRLLAPLDAGSRREVLRLFLHGGVTVELWPPPAGWTAEDWAIAGMTRACNLQAQQAATALNAVVEAAEEAGEVIEIDERVSAAQPAVLREDATALAGASPSSSSGALSPTTSPSSTDARIAPRIMRASVQSDSVHGDGGDADAWAASEGWEPECEGSLEWLPDPSPVGGHWGCWMCGVEVPPVHESYVDWETNSVVDIEHGRHSRPRHPTRDELMRH